MKYLIMERKKIGGEFSPLRIPAIDSLEKAMSYIEKELPIRKALNPEVVLKIGTIGNFNAKKWDREVKYGNE